MNREFVLRTIKDFYINPQIFQKNFEIGQSKSNDEKRLLELDIKIMNEIREYLEENLN